MVLKPPSINQIKKKVEFKEQPIQRGDILYLFGRNPILSLGELLALFRKRKTRPHFLVIDEYGAIVRSQITIDLKEAGALLRKIKIVGMISKKSEAFKSTTKALLKTILYDIVFLMEKSNWTISIFNFKSSNNGNNIREEIHRFCKREIKEQGIRKAFYIKGQQTTNVTPQRLKRKTIIENGMELVLFKEKGKVYMGVTQQVIDIDALDQRDHNRPFTRPLLLLGLALARTMINFTYLGVSHPFAIYDPFCGMGSIVGEAYCKGLLACGSDIDPVCIRKARKNLTWLSEQHQFHQNAKAFPSKHIFVMDITQPKPHFSEKFEGSVVTEPDLLHPMKDYPTLSQAHTLMQQFEENYWRYLQSISNLLSSKQVCVFIFPRIRTSGNHRISLNYPDILEEFDCKILSFHIDHHSFPAIFVHAWKKHIIEREIVVFQKLESQ